MFLDLQIASRLQHVVFYGIVSEARLHCRVTVEGGDEFVKDRARGPSRRVRVTWTVRPLHCMLSQLLLLLITLERHMSVPCGEAGRPYVHGPASLETQDRQDLVEPDYRLMN